VKSGRGDRIRTYDLRYPKSLWSVICWTMIPKIWVKYGLICHIRNILHTQSLISVSCRCHVNWACSSSKALRILSSAFFSKWPYLSIVILIDLCPSRSLISFKLISIEIRFEAWVCLRKWRLQYFSSTFLRRVFHLSISADLCKIS